MAPKKQQKMALGDFLTDQSLGSWADEMEGQPMTSSTAGYGTRSTYGVSTSSYGGGMGGSDSFGARNAAGYAVREQLPMPTAPPYTAHLGNLSFDVTVGDIEEFLCECEVKDVRIIEDKIERRPKGFAYVEFKTLDGLKKAVDLPDKQFQGRNIRISVADAPKAGEQTRELNDWTRKGPLPDMPGARRPSDRMGGEGMGGDRMGGDRMGGDRMGGDRMGATFNRGFEAAPEMGERSGRRPFFEGDNKSRDLGNWERKGPLVPSQPPAEHQPSRPARDFGEARERRVSPAANQEAGNSDSGSRPPRERPIPERAPTAADSDTQWRARMRPDAPSPATTTEPSTPSSPTAASAVPAVPVAPAQRPRLNLQKRTVSEAPSAETTSTTDAKASPFGAARPIDTRAREAAVEERRQLLLRQKREAEEKARDEKKAREAAKLAERPDRDGSSNAAKDSAASTPRENGRLSKASSRKNSEVVNSPPTGPSVAGKQYEILRRMEDTKEETGFDGPNADANGAIIGDKETKPQEIVRKVSPRGDEDGATASGNSNSNSNTPSEPTTTELEDDGFQVVEKKGRRGGNRALAS